MEMKDVKTWLDLVQFELDKSKGLSYGTSCQLLARVKRLEKKIADAKVILDGYDGS